MQKFVSYVVARGVLAALVALGVAGAGGFARATEGSHADAQEVVAPTFTGPAVMAVVSIVDQRISIYDANGGVMSAPVSSGRTEYETPVGVYSVLQKNRDHTSNLYEDAAMPFMQRMTWSGVALHGGALPGYPASAGCVRLPHKFASEIFELTKLGTRIVVARRDVAPVPFSHSALPKPQPANAAQPLLTRTAFDPAAKTQDKSTAFEPDLGNWPEQQAAFEALKAAAEAKAAEAQKAAEPVQELKGEVKTQAAAEKKAGGSKRAAERAKARAESRVKQAERRLSAAKQPATIKSREDALQKAQAALAKAEADLAQANMAAEAAGKAHAEAKERLAAAEAAQAKADTAAKEARRKTLPISVFVSLKEQRLYIRQGHEAVLDVPVTISNPETPIGTHVFTAVDYQDGAEDMRWTVVSIGPYAAGQDGYAKSKEPTPTDPARAGAALERIDVPEEIATRISEALWPGSSLIISDEGLSKETGESTDFVVLISGEPQGGIVVRPRRERQPEYYAEYDDDPYYYYEDRRYNRRYERRYGRYDRYDRDDRYNRYERRPPPRDRSFFGLW